MCLGQEFEVPAKVMNSKIPRQALTQYRDERRVISRTEGNMHAAGYESAAIYFHVQTQSVITYRGHLMSITSKQLYPVQSPYHQPLCKIMH